MKREQREFREIIRLVVIKHRQDHYTSGGFGMKNKNQTYDDIINMSHHVSKKHKSMTMYERAAQFAPFAALTGHDEAICETSRITENKKELDDDMKRILDDKIAYIKFNILEKPEISIKYFIPDEKKQGGGYTLYSGNVDKIDNYKRVIKMTDGSEIPIDNIMDIKLL